VSTPMMIWSMFLSWLKMRPGIDRRGQDCEGTQPSGSYEVTARPLPGQPDGRQVNAMTRSQS
jgi:hypothetical protein